MSIKSKFNERKPFERIAYQVRSSGERHREALVYLLEFNPRRSVDGVFSRNDGTDEMKPATIVMKSIFETVHLIDLDFSARVNSQPLEKSQCLGGICLCSGSGEIPAVAAAAGFRSADCHSLISVPSRFSITVDLPSAE
ncbi:MAG TPA: hypothetical protein VKI65_10080 [Gemmataceae bacterium]|nr:hypothetical protein [Gemmataceae bacterium]